jgi:hypothetical protein
LSFWQLVWKQVSGVGPMAAVAAVGLLLTVVLLAVGPLYLATLDRLAFSRALDGMRTNIHPQVYVPYTSFASDEYRKTRADVTDAARSTLGDALAGQGVYASTRLMDASILDLPETNALAYFQYRSDMDGYVQAISGRLPEASPEGPIEVAIGEPTASALGLEVGHRFTIETRLPPPSPAFEAVLVGVLTPTDLREEYWLGQGGPYFETAMVNDQWVLPLFISETALLERVGAQAPALLGNANDFLYLDRDEVLDTGPQETASRLHALEGRLSSAAPSALLFAGLMGQTEGFRGESSRTQAPLVIVLVLMVTVVLYTLAMVSFALTSRQERPVALLRSRGASLLGAMAVAALWMLALLALGLAAAPLIAAGLVLLIGRTSGWQAVLDGASLTPAPLLPVLPWAALGVGLALVLFLAASLRAARIPLALLHGRRGRPETRPWFQRFYLDVGVFLVAGAIAWQLRGRSGVLAAPAQGMSPEATVDRAALIVPGLALLAATLLFFRAFPLLVRAAGWGTRRVGLLAPSLALERMGRAPGAAMALGGLFLLTAALGAFVATFGGTLDRHAEDLASFLAGADARVHRAGGYEEVGFQELERSFRDVEGVEDASAMYMSVAGTGVLQVGALAPLVGIDPISVGGLLWFRDDFADRPLADLLVEMAVAEQGTVRPRAVPETAARVGVWVLPEAPKSNRFLWLHLTDALGRQHTYSMGALDFSEWRLMEVSLARGDQPAPPGPYAIRSILVYETAQGAAGAPGSLLLDDLTVTDADGQTTVIDPLDQTTDWLPVLTTGGRRDQIEVANGRDQAHRDVLRFAWGRETLEGVRGIYLSPGSRAVPVLMTPSLMAEMGLGIGREGALWVAGRVVPIRVVGEVRRFPMVEEGASRFVVAHGPVLLAHANSINVGRPVWPNQALLGLSDDPAQRQAALSAIASAPGLTGNVIDREVLRQERQRSPLASAGWRGLAVLAVAASLLALTLGVAAHAAGVAQDRKVDMAVLRSLGLRRVHALASYLIEYLLVAVLGVVGGVFIGLWLSRFLVPLFQGTAATPDVPPLVLSPDWMTVGGVAAAVLIGALLCTAFLWRLFSGLSVASVLRAEGE